MQSRSKGSGFRGLSAIANHEGEEGLLVTMEGLETKVEGLSSSA